MLAFYNVVFAGSIDNNFSIATLNRLADKMQYGQFFSRTTGKGETLLIRAPLSFRKWLKTQGNVDALPLFGLGKLGKRDPKFTGLFWREEKHKLYALYDGRTIPWSSWVKWCSKKRAARKKVA